MNTTTDTATAEATETTATLQMTVPETATGILTTAAPGPVLLECAVDRDALRTALGRVAWAVPKNTPLPALTGVLLRADETGLHLRACTPETAASARCEADVAAPGAALVPARLLKDLAERLPPGAIALAALEAGARLQVSWGNGRAKLACFPAESYPVERATTGKGLRIDTTQWAAAIRHTAFCAAEDTAGRPLLVGIRVRIRSGGIDTLTCNGIRVARWATVGEGQDGEADEAVILAKDAERAATALAEAGGDALTVYVEPAFVEIATPDLRVQIGRLAGNYPDIESLLPSTYPEQARVGRADLAATLGRALVVGNANNLFLVRMKADEQGLTLEASSPDAGTASDHVAGEASPGFAMNLNGRQLAEAMGHIEGEQVLIESETGKPLRLTGGDARFAYWQMPVRVD